MCQQQQQKQRKLRGLSLPKKHPGVALDVVMENAKGVFVGVLITANVRVLVNAAINAKIVEFKDEKTLTKILNDK